MFDRCKQLAVRLLSDDRGQAQVPDLIKLAAVALPILIGLVAAYKYYGQSASQGMQQATSDGGQSISTP